MSVKVTWLADWSSAEATDDLTASDDSLVSKFSSRPVLVMPMRISTMLPFRPGIWVDPAR